MALAGAAVLEVSQRSRVRCLPVRLFPRRPSTRKRSWTPGSPVKYWLPVLKDGGNVEDLHRQAIYPSEVLAVRPSVTAATARNKGGFSVPGSDADAMMTYCSQVGIHLKKPKKPPYENVSP